MASANLDLVRSILAPWTHGDFSSVDWADPEIEWVVVDGPEPGRRAGLVGLAEGWREILGACDEYRTGVDEYRELDDERVLVLAHASARGKASGVGIGHFRANLFCIRDGKVTRIVTHYDSRHALADLSLVAEAG
jgi:ketosteroid isomerase-like protein